MQKKIFSSKLTAQKILVKKSFMIDSINRVITTPSYLYNQVETVGLAAVAGGTYGLVGRKIFPKTGINPINYAVWFIVAFQIKKVFEQWELQALQTLNAKFSPEILESNFIKQTRYYYRIGTYLKDILLSKIDLCFSYVFSIRCCHLVTQENVQDASFLEMCRFRVWNVFKSTIIDNASFAIARVVTHHLGFALPMHTSIPIFLAIETIIQNIILVPLIYKYMDFCNHLDLDVNLFSTPSERAAIFKRQLPAI